MPTVILCLPEAVEQELIATLLWRGDALRHPVRSLEEARSLLGQQRVDLLVLDRSLDGIAPFIQQLRRDQATRRLSIAILAGEDFDPAEVEWMEAGANAVLRLPVTSDWDDRLSRLMTVPTRKDVRFPVEFEILARTGIGVEQWSVLAVNLSVNGMRIESTYPLSVGDDIDFSLRLPGRDEPVSGAGRVMREAGRGQYGIEFYGLEGDGAHEIWQFLEKLNHG